MVIALLKESLERYPGLNSLIILYICTFTSPFNIYPEYDLNTTLV